LSKLEEMFKCDENRAVFGNAIFFFFFRFEQVIGLGKGLG